MEMLSRSELKEVKDSFDESRRPEVIITDVKMKFGSMVVFMLKWTLASIPAFLILAVGAGLIYGFIAALANGFAGNH